MKYSIKELQATLRLLERVVPKVSGQLIEIQKVLDSYSIIQSEILKGVQENDGEDGKQKTSDEKTT